MKLKIDRSIPKQVKLSNTFVYDFAKAKKSVKANMINMHSEDTIAEEKFDGSRYGGVITSDGVKMISRNGIDRAKNIPYITKVLKEIFPPNTIVDGEVVHINAPRSVRWEKARSVMGTKEYTSNIEPAQYVIYDIQYLNGECLRNKPLYERRIVLSNYFAKIKEEIIQGETTLNTSTICLPRQFNLSLALQLYQSIILDKGEGIMLKSPKESYAKSWTKVKKSFSIDCFVTGVEKGKGKYAGLIGSLKLSVLQGDIRVEVGKTSGMTDAERSLFTKMALDKKLLNTVIEVEGNEVTKNMKIRHPRFLRLRSDKPWQECSIEQLEVHLK